MEERKYVFFGKTPTFYLYVNETEKLVTLKQACESITNRQFLDHSPDCCGCHTCELKLMNNTPELPFYADENTAPILWEKKKYMDEIQFGYENGIIVSVLVRFGKRKYSLLYGFRVQNFNLIDDTIEKLYSFPRRKTITRNYPVLIGENNIYIITKRNKWDEKSFRWLKISKQDLADILEEREMARQMKEKEEENTRYDGRENFLMYSKFYTEKREEEAEEEEDEVLIILSDSVHIAIDELWRSVYHVAWTYEEIKKSFNREQFRYQLGSRVHSTMSLSELDELEERVNEASEINKKFTTLSRKKPRIN